MQRTINFTRQQVEGSRIMSRDKAFLMVWPLWSFKFFPRSSSVCVTDVYKEFINFMNQ